MFDNPGLRGVRWEGNGAVRRLNQTTHTKRDTTMQEINFTLAKTNEVPDRFRASELTFEIPATLAEVRGLVADGVDADEVLVDYFNRQYRLAIQKRIKDILASDAVKEMDVAAAIEHAVTKATSERLGAPRAKGEGRKSKVAQAEAKATAAIDAARQMYLAMPAAMRKQFRPQLLASGQFTEQQLDEMDASLKR